MALTTAEKVAAVAKRIPVGFWPVAVALALAAYRADHGSYPDKLDVLGGYLRSDDDWQDEPGAKVTHFISNGYRAELDYYIQRGFAVMARYDRMKQTIASGPANHTEAWNLGGEKALTDLGNVVVRATYGQERDQDPVAGSAITDKLFKLDVRLMW